MNDKKVVILLSTYNGEKFIKEQMDSILNQTYKNIEILVRDDGSKDNTVNIIEKYQEKNNNIKLIKGENLGFIKSFFELLKESNADYYSYADQDDIWLENKVELAVEALNKLDDTKPNMVFSNSDYYDENMNFIGEGEKNRKYSFLMSLYSCVGQGMTMMINNKAKDMIIKNIPERCLFHDWWTYMLCMGLGNVAYNNVTTVKYRRMQKNATSEGQGIIKLIVWRIKNLILKNGIKDIKTQMLYFKKLYYNDLTEDKKKIMDIFVNEKYNFILALKKAFYPQRIRSKIIDEIIVRGLFVIGVL